MSSKFLLACSDGTDSQVEPKTSLLLLGARRKPLPDLWRERFGATSASANWVPGPVWGPAPLLFRATESSGEATLHAPNDSSPVFRPRCSVAGIRPWIRSRPPEPLRDPLLQVVELVADGARGDLDVAGAARLVAPGLQGPRRELEELGGLVLGKKGGGQRGLCAVFHGGVLCGLDWVSQGWDAGLGLLGRISTARGFTQVGRDL